MEVALSWTSPLSRRWEGGGNGRHGEPGRDREKGDGGREGKAGRATSYGMKDVTLFGLLLPDFVSVISCRIVNVG